MNKILAILSCILLATNGPVLLAQTEWTGASDNNFFNDANWTGTAPGSTNDHAVIDGGNNLPAVIAADTGTIEIGAISLGPLDAGGHILQNGGTLILFGDDLGLESQIGDLGTEPSSWIMNGDSVVLYDAPLDGDGDGLESDGTGKDFDVGKSVPEDAVGRLELHDNAILRISDDLKIADGDNGHAEIFLDGNSQITVGSGISASGTNSITVAGNALILTGNSAGPGQSATGRTDEGYLTLSTSESAEATVEVSENGRIYARTLQQRNGISSVTVKDNGQFHVFEAFENAEPSLGNATVEGSVGGPQRTSHVSSAATGQTFITLMNDAVMTIDSDLDDSGWSGFALSGGTNNGQNSEGGETVVAISDNATFAVQQDLHMTLGTSEDATSTLSIKGPNATVNINGDLRMALDEFDEENFGTAILEAVLTADSHSMINVGGTAWIGNGSLNVELDGYTPRGGESYPLLTAQSVNGEFTDVTLPPLADGLSWDLSFDATSVLLTISGGSLTGDFNGDGQLGIEDIDQLVTESAAGNNAAGFDLNTDGAVNNLDVVVWAKDLANTWIGDANVDGEFNSSDLVKVFQGGKFEQDVAAVWGDGDWNGDGRFNSGDFVAAFQDGGFEVGQRVAAAVPEPSAQLLILIGSICILTFRRSR